MPAICGLNLTSRLAELTEPLYYDTHLTGRPAGLAGAQTCAREYGMDALSTILKTVKLEGAVFYNAEFTAPWCVRSPHSLLVAPYLTVEPRHVILYHFVTHGRAYANLESGQRVSLTAGDIVVFPYGDAHYLGNGRDIEPRDHGKMIQEVIAQGLKPAQYGGGGEVTRFVCGYLMCDPQLAKAFLGGLPPIFKVNISGDPTGQWLENSIRYSVGQAADSQAGSEIVVAKLSEALFVETLRRYVDALPQEQTGWLAGSRDPEVGAALALLHRQPAEPWTIAELGKQVGVSRSVLAERFQSFLGVPPMAYLTQWRLRLGAHLLTSTSRSVAQIAVEVGYESEAAFNRAFKREYGTPPARFRKEARASGEMGIR